MKHQGFLTAVYMGLSNEKFINAEIHRLQYHISKNGEMQIRNALGDKLSYPNVGAFREDWDTNSMLIRQVTIDKNPDLGDLE